MRATGVKIHREMGGTKKLVGGKSASQKALARMRRRNRKGGMHIKKDTLTPFIIQEARRPTSRAINAAQMALEDAGDFHLSESAKILIAKDKVDVSTLVKSGLKVSKPLKVTTTYRAKHAAPVEDGQRPHYVNPKYLIPWAKRRLKGSYTSPKTKRVYTTPEEKAQAVAWKIYHHGVPPVGYFRKGFVGVAKFMQKRFEYHKRRIK